MTSDIWRRIVHNNRALTSSEEWDLEKIDEHEALNWFREHFNLAGILCVAYVIVVFGGQSYMEKREKFDLRKPLLCWSAILAIFSIIGSIRCVITFGALYEDYGLRGIVCSNKFYIRPIGRFWGFAFCLSKAPELVDTVFIVLRKQRLIFLHWYHHITVLLFSWHCYEGHRAGGAVFMMMNLIVHSMMYSYYACRAARVRIPRFISIIITTSQILQMVLGVYTFYWIYRWRNDEDCKSTDDHLWYGILMYSSYLILFCHFFYNAYIKKHTRPEDKNDKSEVKNAASLNGQETQPVSTQNGKPLDGKHYELRSRRNIRRAIDD